MTTVGEKTYSEFSRLLRNYCEEQHIYGPTHLYEKLKLNMGRSAPSLSQCKAAYTGKRIFSLKVGLYMLESMSFNKLHSKYCEADRNRHNEIVKHNGQTYFAARGFK